MKDKSHVKTHMAKDLATVNRYLKDYIGDILSHESIISWMDLITEQLGTTGWATDEHEVAWMISVGVTELDRLLDDL